MKIVLTGGPGTGKTTIMKQLDALGYYCQHEISRQVILEGKKKGIDQLFLKDPLAFSTALFNGRKAQYIKALETSESPSKTAVFFDRGLPDVIAYMDYLNQESPQNFLSDCDTYRYDYVFILPPWQAIHTRDNERYESFEQSENIHRHIVDRYKHLGYPIITVPTGTVTQRSDFILNHLNIK